MTEGKQNDGAERSNGDRVPPVPQAAAIEVERKAVEIAAAKNQTQAQAMFERARGWLDALVWLGEVSAEQREKYLVEVLGVALFKRLNRKNHSAFGAEPGDLIMERVRYVLWAWAPLSRRWYQEGASATGPEGLALLRRVVATAAEGVRLEIRTEAGEVVQPGADLAPGSCGTRSRQTFRCCQTEKGGSARKPPPGRADLSGGAVAQRRRRRDLVGAGRSARLRVERPAWGQWMGKHGWVHWAEGCRSISYFVHPFQPAHPAGSMSVPCRWFLRAFLLDGITR